MKAAEGAPSELAMEFSGNSRAAAEQARNPAYRQQQYLQYSRPKEEKSALNFKKWLLTLVSICNMILSPLIMYMGYSASQYDYNGIMVVDKALIVLGAFVFLISIGCIASLHGGSEQYLIYVFYSAIIALILLTVFAIGAISFSDNLIDWIDQHWSDIRPRAGRLSMADFKTHAQGEIVSLGAMALTIDFSLFLMLSSIMVLLRVRKIMLTLFPLTNLLFIVFSSAILMVAIYCQQHSYYTSAMPTWFNYVLVAIAGGVILLACFGYYSVAKGNFAGLVLYIVMLALSAMVCLITGLGILMGTQNLRQAVDKDWPNIDNRLRAQGYEVSQVTFASFIELNLKFAGLFVILFTLFLILGLFPAIYLSVNMKRPASPKKIKQFKRDMAHSPSSPQSEF